MPEQNPVKPYSKNEPKQTENVIVNKNERLIVPPIEKENEIVIVNLNEKENKNLYVDENLNEQENEDSDDEIFNEIAEIKSYLLKLSELEEENSQKLHEFEMILKEQYRPYSATPEPIEVVEPENFDLEDFTFAPSEKEVDDYISEVESVTEKHPIESDDAGLGIFDERPKSHYLNSKDVQANVPSYYLNTKESVSRIENDDQSFPDKDSIYDDDDSSDGCTVKQSVSSEMEEDEIVLNPFKPLTKPTLISDEEISFYNEDSHYINENPERKTIVRGKTFDEMAVDPDYDKTSCRQQDSTAKIQTFPWTLQLLLPNLLFYQDSDISLLRETLSFEFWVNLISILFFGMMTFIGFLIETPINTLSFAMMIIFYNIKTLIHIGVKDWGFFRQRQKQIHCLEAASPHLRNWLLNPFENEKRQNIRKHFLQAGSLKERFKQRKPESKKASTKPKTHSIRPIRKTEDELKPTISQTIVKFVDERPYITASLQNGQKIMCLVDSGATSSAIRPHLIEKLQETHPVPRVKKCFSLQGVIPGVTANGKDVALITLTLENGYELKNIPFIVHDSGNDLLIGTNVIKAFKWSNHWEGDRFYIQLGNKEPGRVEATFRHQSELDACTINNIVLQPNEKQMIPLRIPTLTGLGKTTFHGKDVYIRSCGPEDDSQDIEIVSSLARLRKDTIPAHIINHSKHPIQLESGTPIATVQVFNKNSNSPDILDLNDISIFREKINTIPFSTHLDCHCKLGKGDVLIYFTDHFGHTFLNKDLLYFNHTTPALERIKTGTGKMVSIRSHSCFPNTLN